MDSALRRNRRKSVRRTISPIIRIAAVLSCGGAIGSSFAQSAPTQTVQKQSCSDAIHVIEHILFDPGQCRDRCSDGHGVNTLRFRFGDLFRLWASAHADYQRCVPEPRGTGGFGYDCGNQLRR